MGVCNESEELVLNLGDSLPQMFIFILKLNETATSEMIPKMQVSLL